jgi:hypothetical protein
MYARRRLLELGVFLVAAGGVMLLVETNVVDRETVVGALALWPLVIVAIGAHLILRRTSLAVPGGLVAAIVPGLLVGGLFVAVPNIPSACGDGTQGTFTAHGGDLSDSAIVDLALACGQVSVTTGPGTSWQLDAADGTIGAPNVVATADRLSITSATGTHSWNFGRGDDWRLRLPTGSTIDMHAKVDAGKGTFDLDGARIGMLDLQVNAGEAEVHLGGATLSHLSMRVNAAAGFLTLGDDDLSGDLTVNAGSLQVCAPGELGLRVHGTTSLGATNYFGLIRSGDAWETPGYASATHHADLGVSANVGSVNINPVGGCK